MSMCKALQMEFWKCRRRMVGLVCLAFVAVQLLWVGRTLFDMTPEELSQGWMLIIYDLILIDAIMMPTTAAVLASRNCDLEHKGSTLKLLETLVPAGRLFDAKLCWGAIHIAATLLARTAGFLLLGRLLGLPEQVPWDKFGLLFFFSFFVSLTIYLLQQDLSLFFQNQAVALVLGLFGSFVGLLSMFFPQWVQKLVIWGYYGVLAIAGMNWDPDTRVTEFYWMQIDLAGRVIDVAHDAGAAAHGRHLRLGMAGFIVLQIKRRVQENVVREQSLGADLAGELEQIIVRVALVVVDPFLHLKDVDWEDAGLAVAQARVGGQQDVLDDHPSLR